MEQGIGEARTTGDDVHAEGAEQVGEGASSRVRDTVEKAEQARASRRREGLGWGWRPSRGGWIEGAASTHSWQGWQRMGCGHRSSIAGGVGGRGRSHGGCGRPPYVLNRSRDLSWLLSSSTLKSTFSKIVLIS
jgi:hypothetical protein